MTNYEMIKRLDIYAMALTIMCPFEADFWGEYRCGEESRVRDEMNCARCKLAWLGETDEGCEPV